MRQSIRRLIQYAGLIIAGILPFNGTTHNPLTSEDNSPAASASLLNIKEPDSSTKTAVAENYGKLPLSFEANNGQVDEEVKFLSRGNGYTLFLTSDELVLSLRRGSNKKYETHSLRKSPQADESNQSENEVIRLKNIGANPNPQITGLEELPGKSNYFIGNDPEKWRTNISNYAKVKVDDIYPGIDLIYYGNQNQLEYDWVVAPGADPKTIRFTIESKAELKVDSRGNLVLDEKGELHLNNPLIYQERGGNRTEIAGQYVLLNRREVGIQVDKYDIALPLVIDPILHYSTYLGGNGWDRGNGIAVDSSGNAYVTGWTQSTDFPTSNPFQASISSGLDAFVTKLNAAGNALIYSTYFGGDGSEQGNGITVDTFGNAYVAGETRSGNFPTANPFQAYYGGGVGDAFVIKLNASGNMLVYSTYLGGESYDNGYGIAVDTFNAAFITGETHSIDFPTANPFQAYLDGDRDAFVTKLNPAGNLPIYSTFLGGDDLDQGNGVAVDTSGSACVTGWTLSTDFPLENPFQAISNGNFDVFVTKLNPAGNSLVYSTYFGGNGLDQGNGIAIDVFGNAYVTGRTTSTNLPTINPIQASNGGNYDAFVIKVNTSGSALFYSTYLGGYNDDNGRGIAADASGNAYVTGETSSADFPTVDPVQSGSGGNFDAFATKLNAVGDALVYSTYLGGYNSDNGRGIAVDVSGNAYVTGETISADFPTRNPFQAIYGGGDYDAFVTKIGVPSCFFFPEIAVGGGWFSTFAFFNTGYAPTSGELILTDQQGDPLDVSSLELGTGSSFPFSIMPGGTMFLTIDSLNPGDPAEQGWAKAEFWGGSLSGVATYQFESEGVVTALAGVLPSQPMQFATIPVDDNVGQTRTTAYAIGNPTDQTILIKICFVDTDGIVVDDTITIELDPGEQIARYFFQDLGLTEFRGSMVLRAQGDGKFIAVALIQNQDLFTVTPVEASKAPDIPN